MAHLKIEINVTGGVIPLPLVINGYSRETLAQLSCDINLERSMASPQFWGGSVHASRDIWSPNRGYQFSIPESLVQIAIKSRPQQILHKMLTGDLKHVDKSMFPAVRQTVFPS